MLDLFLVQYRHDVAVDPDQQAVETLAPVQLFLQRRLYLMPRPVGEVGAAG
jgi:hypothetical protein